MIETIQTFLFRYTCLIMNIYACNEASLYRNVEERERIIFLLFFRSCAILGKKLTGALIHYLENSKDDAITCRND